MKPVAEGRRKDDRQESSEPPSRQGREIRFVDSARVKMEPTGQMKANMIPAGQTEAKMRPASGGKEGWRPARTRTGSCVIPPYALSGIFGQFRSRRTGVAEIPDKLLAE